MSRFGSSQADVKRLRESRVMITHEVHLPNNTIAQESLPLVIGVIADLSGDSEGTREPLRDAGRDFVRISAESFDKILAGARPRLDLTVPDSSRGQGKIQVTLNFRSLDDFHPDRFVREIPELAAQLRVRKTLDNLRSLIASDPKLQAQLEEVLLDPEKRAAFLDEMSSRR